MTMAPRIVTLLSRNAAGPQIGRFPQMTHSLLQSNKLTENLRVQPHLSRGAVRRSLTDLPNLRRVA